VSSTGYWPELGEVALQHGEFGAADDGAQVSKRVALGRVGGEIGVELGLGEVPGIDVLARRRGVERDERLPAVVERGGDRAAVEPVKGAEVAAVAVGAAGKRIAGLESAAVALRFEDVLEDAADLQQVSDGRAFARAEVGEARREAGGLRLVENLLDQGG
jgi:hypothetical protein